MENKRLPRPTPSDYEKRAAYHKSQTEGNGSSSVDEYLEFVNTLDWSAELFKEEGKYGLKNALGEMLLPPDFENFSLLTYAEINKGDRVVAMQNGKYGVVLADGTGTWLVSPEYDYIGYPNQITHVYKDGKCGILDLINGGFLIPLECESVDDYNGFLFCNGIGFYEKGGKTGVINRYASFTRPVFEEAERGAAGNVKVKFEGQWGFIDEDNQFTTVEDKAYYTYDI